MDTKHATRSDLTTFQRLRVWRKRGEADPCACQRGHRLRHNYGQRLRQSPGTCAAIREVAISGGGRLLFVGLACAFAFCSANARRFTNRHKQTNGNDRMLMINWTGLKRFYYLPSFEYDRFDSIWYCCVRFLGVEFSVYSRSMASAMIRTLNEQTELLHAA